MSLARTLELARAHVVGGIDLETAVRCVAVSAAEARAALDLLGCPANAPESELVRAFVRLSVASTDRNAMGVIRALRTPPSPPERLLEWAKSAKPGEVGAAFDAAIARADALTLATKESA